MDVRVIVTWIGSSSYLVRKKEQLRNKLKFMFVFLSALKLWDGNIPSRVQSNKQENIHINYKKPISFVVIRHTEAHLLPVEAGS